MERRNRELAFVVAFVMLNLAAPFIGERYPFTVAPMFRDQPAEYCVYQVFAPDGSLMPAEQFDLHLVYDGNPPGLGMGIKPREPLHPFGCVGTEQQVRVRVQEVLAEMPTSGPDFVVVHQEHVHVIDNQLKTERHQWKIER